MAVYLANRGEVNIPKATEIERIIVLVYTHKVISTKSERKPLKVPFD